MWSPMVELVSDREFATGEKTKLDMLPQFQVTFSRRQHIRANVGVQVAGEQPGGTADTTRVLRPVGLVRRRVAAGVEMIRGAVCDGGWRCTRRRWSAGREGNPAAAAEIPHIGPVHRMPQRAVDAIRRGHLDRLRLARRIMANSSRDPYWQAGVRREVLDHPCVQGRHRRRVFEVPHADPAIRGEAERTTRRESSRICRSPPMRRRAGRQRTECPAPSATRSAVKGWDQRKLQRRIRDGSARRGRRPCGVRSVSDRKGS